MNEDKKVQTEKQEEATVAIPEKKAASENPKVENELGTLTD